MPALFLIHLQSLHVWMCLFKRYGSGNLFLQHEKAEL